MLNDHLSRYAIPLVQEAPQIDQQVGTIAEPTGPFGATGDGMPTTSATALTIPMVITNTIGIRLYKIPVNPEKSWEATNPMQQV